MLTACSVVGGVNEKSRLIRPAYFSLGDKTHPAVRSLSEQCAGCNILSQPFFYFYLCALGSLHKVEQREFPGRCEAAQLIDRPSITCAEIIDSGVRGGGVYLFRFLRCRSRPLRRTRCKTIRARSLYMISIPFPAR